MGKDERGRGDRSGHGDRRPLELSEVEETLARLPKAQARPEFREDLHRQLYERAAGRAPADRAAAQTTLGSRRERREHREPRRASSSWKTLAAAAAIAVVLAGGVSGGLRLNEQRRLEALPKLPFATQELVGAGGRYSAVKEATYELATPLPTAPRKASAFAPKLAQFSRDEAQALGDALGFKTPLALIPGEYRFEEPVGSPELGRLVEISTWEARVGYNDYAEPSPGAAVLTQDQAVAAARAFADRLKLPYKAGTVVVTLQADRDQYEVQFIESLAGRQALGFQTRVWVHRRGGGIASFYFVRVGYEPVGDYPIITAAQAFEKLKTQTVYAEHDRIAVRLDRVELVYYNYPSQNVPTEDTRMQPTYVFSGTDNYGQPFEALVPAVNPEYVQGGQ
ncbi:MAG: hypothetical protein ACYC41_11635 [Bacillota bacterium]